MSFLRQLYKQDISYFSTCFFFPSPSYSVSIDCPLSSMNRPACGKSDPCVTSDLASVIAQLIQSFRRGQVILLLAFSLALYTAKGMIDIHLRKFERYLNIISGNETGRYSLPVLCYALRLIMTGYNCRRNRERLFYLGHPQ